MSRRTRSDHPLPEGVRIWSPEPEQVGAQLRDSIATGLAAAFSSGPWAGTPMPVGDRDDPHSARGILAQLQRQPQILLASAVGPAAPYEARRILGCVLGAVLDEPLIGAYGLAPFGARPGDGLLAYIGVVPAAQGIRLQQGAFGHRASTLYRTSRSSGPDTVSLASVLFAGWLAQPVASACPTVFVRTRRVLKPIIHLATKNGFEFSGSFALDFHGERQDRMVFRRERRVA